MVVQGQVTPDEFMVFKPTLKTGFAPIIKKNIGEKKNMMIYRPAGILPAARRKRELKAGGDDDDAVPNDAGPANDAPASAQKGGKGAGRG